MAHAYRRASTDARAELLEERDLLFEWSDELDEGPVQEEIVELRVRLENAELDPVFDVRRDLRDLALAIAAAREVKAQRSDKRRSLVRRIVFAGLSCVAIAAVSLGVQLADYQDFARHCEVQCWDGQCNAAIRHEGLLELDFHCVAETVEDCAKPCEADGSCVPVQGQCMPTLATHCEASASCRENGECSLVEGECAHGSNSECRRSMSCQAFGQCTFSDGACRALTDADCRETSGCKEYGRCTAVHGRCERDSSAASLSDEDCARIAHCVKTGFCPASEACEDVEVSLSPQPEHETEQTAAPTVAAERGRRRSGPASSHRAPREPAGS